MSSIDERVVQMKFQNADFVRGVEQTLAALDRLNKGLQLQGVTKGLAGVQAVSKQFDAHIQQNRNSLGQFTTGVTATATATQQFGQKLDQNRNSMGQFATATQEVGVHLESTRSFLGKIGSGFSEVVSHVQNFGSRVTQSFGTARQSADGFAEGLSKSSSAVHGLSNLESNVAALAGRFSNLGTIAAGALANIGARASQAGLQLLNSFSFAPLSSGFHEYETNLNSIQTILANTQAAGTNLKDVNGALDELNHYADQTIYNFSEMAKNIGTFTAAGVGLKESTSAIKGIANLAALSGSNSQQASTAMYQLSQAISAGRVSLEDWNSVVNAGMGGTVFQRALAQNAEKMGTLSKGAVKLTGDMKNVTIEGKSFRESITAKPGEESWLTSKVLTQTLAQFTGDLSDAELAAQGFNQAEIQAIQAQAAMAKSAATEVKTLSQLFDTTKEALGSGWTKTWELIFGDFTEAKGLFTGVSNVIGGLVQKSSDARNKMLSDWKDLGGRTALIDSISNIFKALSSVLKPIGEAFRSIFPATTGKQLYDLTVQFRDFTEKLKVGGETADKIKRTFAGVFAVFGIGIDIIGQIVKTIFRLIGVATEGSGGFLNFTAKIGDWLVKVREAIHNGDGLANVFKVIGNVLAIPIKLVQQLGKFLGQVFKGIDSSGATKGLSDFASKLEPMGRLGAFISSAWEKVLTVMRNVSSMVQSAGAKIGAVMGNIGVDVGALVKSLNFKDILGGIGMGSLAALALTIRSFIKNLGGNGPMGMIDKLGESLEKLTGVLGSVQNTLRAATLLQIAIAIGVLTLSMNTLSKIDAAGLAKASAAITVMFGQLLGSLAIFQKFIGAGGFAKLPFVMGSLILLALAVDVLASAVKKLSSLSWGELVRGLTGVSVLLAGLVIALKFMPPSAGLISTGAGLILLAAGIRILVSSVKELSGLSWSELAKGLVGVGALLGALVLFTLFADANAGGVIQGVGLVLLAAGIKILASAVMDLSGMSWKEIAKGLVTLAGSMAVMTGALMLIPPTAPLAALGVVGVALSLKMVAKSLAEMAKMSWGEIGKSLVVMLGAMAIIAAALWIIPPTAPLAAVSILLVAISLKQIGQVLSEFAQFSWGEILKSMVMLGGTLAIIAVAMLAMTTALPGAAATLVIAAALAILAPILMQFSQMTLGEIGKSLLMLAGVFIVFGLAALVLTPVVPMMIALAAAITLLGIGMLFAGAGVFLFATGLTALAAAGTAGAAAIILIVGGLIGLIPEVMKQIGLGLIAFAGVIATSGPAITKALVTVLEALISAIERVTPKIVNMFFKMLTMLYQTMLKYVPNLVDMGMRLINGVLNGIANNIGQMVDAATRVANNFINGIARNLPSIIQSGVNLIVSFINGVTNAINANSAAVGAAGGRLAVAIIRGMVVGLNSGLGEITSAAMRVARSALDAAKNVLGIHSPSKEFEKIGNFVNDGFREGLDGNKDQVIKAFDDLKGMLKELKDDSKASWSERNKASAAYNELTGKLVHERNAIGNLIDRYDVLTDKIKTANDAYEAAVKTRDDYNKSLTDQYSDMASPTGDTKVDDFTEKLKKQIEDTKKFSNALQRLRGFGINDELYKDLLSSGTSALPFVEELLNKGIVGIDEINNLSKDLDTAGAHLGSEASKSMYQAGVDSAKGLLEGLKNEQASIEAIMDEIADRMVKTIKDKLGIRSPSREFMKVGKYSAEGLIRGLDEMSSSVEKAAQTTGVAAVDALSKSLSGFSDLIVSDIDLNPRITPVLDLSSVKKSAGEMGGILGTRAISIDSAYVKARYVADSYASNQIANSDVMPVASSSVSYTQNNYSPKALSAAEIYRQTKNQLSTVKGALGTP